MVTPFGFVCRGAAAEGYVPQRPPGYQKRVKMSARYQVELLEMEPCGADVVSARFSRPPEFEFVAGQWLVLELPADGLHLAETFTICSAPVDDYLQITTRLSGSAFKSALVGLAPGDCGAVTGPGGRLALPSSWERVVFLVGGVGITPARSMLRQATAEGRVFDDALLFYANRDASCVPFEAEFVAMSGNGLRTVLCFEEPAQGWAGERGLITAEMVRRYLVPGQRDRPFIVAGPPPMVESMERVLDALGVPGKYRLVERFSPRAFTKRQREADSPPG
jgi:ferredoxin-NADP reductase